MLLLMNYMNNNNILYVRYHLNSMRDLVKLLNHKLITMSSLCPPFKRKAKRFVKLKIETIINNRNKTFSEKSNLQSYLSFKAENWFSSIAMSSRHSARRRSDSSSSISKFGGKKKKKKKKKKKNSETRKKKITDISIFKLLKIIQFLFILKSSVYGF